MVLKCYCSNRFLCLCNSPLVFLQALLCSASMLMCLQVVGLQMRSNCMNWSQSKGKVRFFPGKFALRQGSSWSSPYGSDSISQAAFFCPVSALPRFCPTLQIIKKQKSKPEQAEADLEWPPSRSSGLASGTISDQSMLTFPGSRRGSYTLWVSGTAQLAMVFHAQKWKIAVVDKYTCCLEWCVETWREQALIPCLDKLSLSCMLS